MQKQHKHRISNNESTQNETTPNKKLLTSPNDPLVAVVADDHGRLKLQALVAAERARLPLAQLARVTQRLGPPLIQLAHLLGVLLLHVEKREKTHTKEKKPIFLS